MAVSVMYRDCYVIVERIKPFLILKNINPITQNRQRSLRETEFQPFQRLKCNLKRLRLSFSKTTLAIFKYITFKKDSKFHHNVFSAIKKVGHRGYLSATTAFLVDIGHIYDDVMLSW